MVLNASANNRRAVEFGGAFACNRRALWIVKTHHLGDASGGVVSDDAVELGMCLKETAALRECCRVRLDGFNRFESSTGTPDQVLLNPDLNLVKDVQRLRI